MKQRLYIEGFGHFPMRDRRDVESTALQCALAASRGTPGRIRCACRREENIILHMESIRSPGPFPGTWHYRVDRRRREDDHHPTCIFRMDSDSEPIDQLELTPGMFDLAAGQKAQPGVSLMDSSGGRWTGFVQYARRCFSTGYTSAFVAVNRGAPVDRMKNPSATRVLMGIEQAIRSWPFRDGRDGKTVAASMGLELCFGFIDFSFQPWVGREGAEAEAVHLWVAHEGRLRFRHCWAPVSTLATVADTVRLFGHVIRPPYLAMGVLEAGERVRHLVIVPVFFDGYDFLFVDSSGERGYFRTLFDLKTTVYRGLDSLADYERLVPPHQRVCRLPNGVAWPCNPDALVYAKPKHQVVECRGFTEDLSRFVEYHERFDFKAELLTKLLAGTAAEFHEVRSADFRHVDLARPAALGLGQRVIREFPPQPTSQLEVISAERQTQ